MLDLQPGDIAACYGTDAVSKLIQAATLSPLAPRGLRVPPSHVALIHSYEGFSGGNPLGWWESTSLCHHPCLLSFKNHSGVQLHDPAYRIRDYVAAGGTVRIFRLTSIDALQPYEEAFLRRYLHKWAGANIAYHRDGAVWSGTRALQLINLLPGADLDTLFCSEMLAALLMRVGRLNRDNPSRFNPGRLLRRLVYEGTYFPHTLYHTLSQLP